MPSRVTNHDRVLRATEAGPPQDLPTGAPRFSGREPEFPQDIEHRLAVAERSVLNDRFEAAVQAQQAVELARARHHPALLAHTLYRAAHTLRDARRPDLAFALSLEAQPMFERLDDAWHAATLLLLRARCCMAVREHERALELAAEAAERFERRAADRVDLARCYLTMASAKRIGGDLDGAVAMAAHARAALDATQDVRHLGRFRNNEAYLRLLLARRLAGEGHAELALAQRDLAAAALPELAEVDGPDWDSSRAPQLNTIVAVHLARNDLAQARPALLRLARWAWRWNGPFERGLAWLRLSDFRLAQQQLGRACVCAKRSVARMAPLSVEPELLAAHQHLAQLLEAAGDLEAAYRAACDAGDAAARQEKEALALRAEMLALDLRTERELREAEQTLSYAQRHSNVGHLVAGVNHELNQPMASIRLLAETTMAMLESNDHAGVRTNLESMLRLSSRLTSMASKLAALPASSRGEPLQVSLKSCVDDAMLALRSRLSATPCQIDLQVSDEVVRVPQSQLVPVISNLLNNALDALEVVEDRCIVMRSSVKGEYVSFLVADNGPGLSAAVLERLFTPFFTTKSAGKGLGLGLALSLDVVREVGGRITARNAVLGGAEFELVLPRGSAA